MSSVRFVHTGDLHLDRPFQGIHGVSQRVANVLCSATFDTFRNIIDCAIDHQVDALLIAGDIYDGADRSLPAQLALVEGLERLDAAGIRSFICHGIHDPLDDWTSRLRLPPLAHRFGTEVEAIPIDSDGHVEVIGISKPYSRSFPEVIREFAQARQASFSVGLLSRDISDSTETLFSSPISYWALGEQHDRRILREQRPTVIYPGNPQGSQPGETGPRGVYLAEIDEHGEATLQFEAVDSVRLASVRIDTASVDSEAELLDLLQAHVEQLINDAHGRPVVYQITFNGDGPAGGDISAIHRIDGIVNQINDRYGDRENFAWCHRVSFEPRTLPDQGRRSRAGDVVASLLQRSEDLQQDSSVRNQLRAELGALFDDDRLFPYRSTVDISDDELIEIIIEAESLVLGELGLLD